MNSRFFLASLLAITTSAAAQTDPFDAPVLDVRPRIFLRNNDSFAGLTLSKLRERTATPEFTGVREKWRRRPLGRAILWMLDGKQADLDAALSGLKKMQANTGSWSDRGQALMQLAALFDWLYPKLDEATRRQIIARIEHGADDASDHVTKGQAPFFYSRTPGALAGLAVAGLALHGASPKADTCLRWTRELIWLAHKHLVVLDVVETPRPGIRVRWQLHLPQTPQLQNGWSTVTNNAPSKRWADDSLRPKEAVGRLFCRTLLPQSHTFILHADGQAKAFDSAGDLRRDARGNPYHLKYGRAVLQIEPCTPTNRTVFLHVLTAVDGPQIQPPRIALRPVGAGQMELSVDDTLTRLSVPDWLTLDLR